MHTNSFSLDCDIGLFISGKAASTRNTGSWMKFGQVPNTGRRSGWDRVYSGVSGKHEAVKGGGGEEGRQEEETASEICLRPTEEREKDRPPW